MKWLAALLLLAAPTALAQVRPQPGPGDPRVQTVMFAPDQVVQLQAAPGYQITVALNPDERIESIALGDSAAWQATANKRGDYLFVKPINAGVTTNMIVITDVRMYAFELVPAYGPMEGLPFAVRFTYPASAPVAAVPSAAAPMSDTTPGRYRLSGDKLLRPSAMADDGVQTEIEWPASAALPAIYAVGDDGREVLATGHVRDGRVVVDRIARKFVFRQDRRVATALRITADQDKKR